MQNLDRLHRYRNCFTEINVPPECNLFHLRGNELPQGHNRCSTKWGYSLCQCSFPGLAGDKFIIQESELLKQLNSSNLILADKGFLIQDIVPVGVSVNILPFLNNGKFTESEARATKFGPQDPLANRGHRGHLR